MSKKTYAIRASIDRSFLDHEIALSGGGFDMRPLPLRVVLFYVAGVLFVGWAVLNTFMGATLSLAIAFVIWSIAAMAFFGRYSKAKEMTFQQIPALLSYLPKHARRVSTRRDDSPMGMYQIAGIEKIDQRGRIHFTDRAVGQGYLVVGSASVLLFDEDRAAILERVDAFFRKIDIDVELITITTKEPQRVYKQLANLERRNLALQHVDPELQNLMDEQFDVLNDYVGKEFKSIHQYIILRADNLEALRSATAVLQSEVENSSMVFKSCVQLTREDVVQMLRTFYRTDG